MYLQLPNRTCVAFLLFALVPVSGQALAQDPDPATRELYGQYCAACHGTDGRAVAGVPDLTDDAWQYGAEPADIERSIAHGRRSVMPSLGLALGDTGLDQVVRYVLSLSRSVDAPPGELQAGKELYVIYCAACHGEQGNGTPALGAPDLTDDVWLYGGSEAILRDVVANGRANEMPAFGNTLRQVDISALARFLGSAAFDQLE